MCEIIPFPLKERMHAIRAKDATARALEEDRREDARFAREYVASAIKTYQEAGFDDAAAWLEACAYQIDCAMENEL